MVLRGSDIMQGGEGRAVERSYRDGWVAALIGLVVISDMNCTLEHETRRVRGGRHAIGSVGPCVPRSRRCTIPDRSLSVVGEFTETLSIECTS